MYRFLIIIEKTKTNYSVYSPDLPGCVATGKSCEEAERNMHKAVEMHIQGMIEDDLPIPQGVTSAEYIAVSV